MGCDVWLVAGRKKEEAELYVSLKGVYTCTVYAQCF